MNTPEDPNLRQPLGQGLPPLSPDTSLEAEEKAMQAGKGKMLGLMLLGLALPIIGIVLYLALSGGDEPYRTLGKNINGLRQSHFDPFWGCSLTGTNLDRIRNNDDMNAQIHRRGHKRATYGRHVREECMTDLDQLEPSLSSLIAPEDMQAEVDELGESVGVLRSAWSAYIAHLDGLGDQSYSEEEADSHVHAITKGWYDYRRIQGDLNKNIRTKLDE